MIFYVKEQFTQKLNISYYLLTLMMMESQVKFRCLQNISGASQQNSVATKVAGTCFKTTQSSEAPNFQFILFISFLKPNSSLKLLSYKRLKWVHELMHRLRV